jgi:hypothetical protein
MFWVSKVLAPAALVVGIAGTAVVVAQTRENQPPDRKKVEDRKGPDDRKTDTQPPDRKRPDGTPGTRPMGDRGQPKPDATVEAWVKVLIEKITDPHDMVRESARGALVHIGHPAIPALRQLAEGNDAAKALAASKVIAMIEQGPGQGGRPGVGGRPGQPGRGPGQPGQPGGRGGAGGGDRGPVGPPGMGPGRPGFPGGPPPGMGPMGPGGPPRGMGPGFPGRPGEPPPGMGPGGPGMPPGGFPPPGGGRPGGEE